MPKNKPSGKKLDEPDVSRDPLRLSLHQRIEAHYDNLPAAELRLADLLLRFPGNLAGYSATELADMSGTSKAAASRLFKRLGFADYTAVRQHIREEQTWGSPIYRSQLATAGKDTAEGRHGQNPVLQHMTSEIASLQATMDGLEIKALGEAVEAMAKAQRIYVLGFRNSYYVSLLLCRQLQRLRKDVKMLPNPGQTLGEDLVDITGDDVIVAIGLRRRIPQFRKALSYIRQKGGRSILIADTTAQKSKELATWYFPCAVDSNGVLDSYTPAISLITLLCNSLFQRNMSKGFSRLRDIEDTHQVLEELLISS